MADNDGEIKLGVTIDSSGADSGASAVQDDLGKVKDSAAVASEGINNSLDNRRAVTHALRGLLELREGGVMALAGLSSEAFVATEAFEGMLGPLALNPSGQPGSVNYEAAKANAEGAYKAYQDLNDKLGSLKEALANYNAYDETASSLKEDTAKNQESIKSLRDQLDKLQLDYGPLTTDRDTAVENERKAQVDAATVTIDQQNQSSDLTGKDTKTNAQRALTDRQADREKHQAALEAQIKAAVNDAVKAQLEEQLAQSKADGEKDEASFKYQFNEIDAKQFGAANAKADSEVGGASAAAQLASLKQEVEQLKKELAARPDHQSLQPFIAAAERQGDLATEAAQLQGIANQIIGAFATTQTARNAQQAEINAANQNAINSLRAKVQAHEGRLAYPNNCN
jgi:chromosome segregation ATPase